MLSRTAPYKLVVCSTIFVLLLFSTQTAFAEDDESDNSHIFTPQIEQSLAAILNVAVQKTNVPSQAVQQLLDFSIKTDSLDPKIAPSKHEKYGTPAFFRTTIALSLRDFMSYTLNPNIPACMLFPSTIRWNEWTPNSEVLTGWEKFVQSPLPPKKDMLMLGVELEETTPDESSNCFYNYPSNRAFILSSTKDKRPALLNISIMNEQSTLGKKGLILDENKWHYAYSDKVGTNLTFLSWAETAIYASACITVAIENPDKKSINLYFYKWTRAGWSGMNAVKTKHIIQGINRFINSFKVIAEPPHAINPSVLAQEANNIKTLSDANLRALIAPIDTALLKSEVKALHKKPFKPLIESGYTSTLSRREAESEAFLIRLRALLNMK